MTAPFFFPEITSGNGWGGPVHDQRAKNIRISARIAYNAAVGVCRQVTSLFCRDGGFLTWAAKPSVGRSPEPRKISGTVSSSRLVARHSPLIDYALLALKLPESFSALFTLRWTRAACLG